MRSITQGWATFSFSFERYEEAPPAVAKQVVEHEIKNVFYEDVENAAIAVVEKIKDYVFMLRQHKNYSYSHLISSNYSLLLKDNDGKTFIDMIQHNWVITCDNIKAE